MKEVKKTEFKSESSIMVHPIQFVKKDQFMLPTWAVIVVLFIAFFLLKAMIYIKDEKRHGK
jgi:hypothetical protein